MLHCYTVCHFVIFDNKLLIYNKKKKKLVQYVYCITRIMFNLRRLIKLNDVLIVIIWVYSYTVYTYCGIFNQN